MAARRKQAVNPLKLIATVPIANPKRKWDASAARRRLKKWATAQGKVDMRKYAEAFLLRDGDPHNLTSYKLPVIDIIQGEPYLIPHAVSAVAAVLHGARGGMKLTSPVRQRLESLAHELHNEIRDEFEYGQGYSREANPFFGRKKKEPDEHWYKPPTFSGVMRHGWSAVNELGRIALLRVDSPGTYREALEAIRAAEELGASLQFLQDSFGASLGEVEPDVRRSEKNARETYQLALRKWNSKYVG